MSSEPIKVLLVEDNPADVQFLREILADAGSARFDLTHCERLSEALARLGEERFEIILLDLSLPDTQGLNTVVRVHGQFATLPIVVLTGLEDEQLAVEALRKGAQDYLVKGKVDGNLLGRSIRYAIERERAEHALQKSERHSRLVIETAGDAFVAIDADGTITDWNCQAEVIFGWSRQEAIGRPLAETIIPPEFGAAHKKGIRHFLANGEGAMFNKRMALKALHRDGHEFPVELMVCPIREERVIVLMLLSVMSRSRSEPKSRFNINANALRRCTTSIYLSVPLWSCAPCWICFSKKSTLFFQMPSPLLGCLTRNPAN
jgi:PAS domain S-box-containing protein